MTWRDAPVVAPYVQSSNLEVQRRSVAPGRWSFDREVKDTWAARHQGIIHAHKIVESTSAIPGDPNRVVKTRFVFDRYYIESA